MPRGAHGRAVTLGIRPEHFIHNIQNGLASEVIIVEPTGAEIQIISQFSGQPVTAVFHERLSMSPGDVLKLAPKPETIHLFDANTGVALREFLPALDQAVQNNCPAGTRADRAGVRLLLQGKTAPLRKQSVLDRMSLPPSGRLISMI